MSDLGETSARQQKHPVSTAARLFGSCPTSCPFVGDDLLEAFDAVLGEGGHAVPFCGIVREADTPIIEEAGERRPALGHLVHRFGEIVAPRELGALLAHPAFQIGDQWRTLGGRSGAAPHSARIRRGIAKNGTRNPPRLNG
jgi:hypothetical protein